MKCFVVWIHDSGMFSLWVFISVDAGIKRDRGKELQSESVGSGNK